MRGTAAFAPPPAAPGATRPGGLGLEVNLFKLGDWQRPGLGNIRETLLMATLDRRSEASRRAFEAQARAEERAYEEAARVQRAQERQEALEASRAAAAQIDRINRTTLRRGGDFLRTSMNRTALVGLGALAVVGVVMAGRRKPKKRRRSRSRRSS